MENIQFYQQKAAFVWVESKYGQLGVDVEKYIYLELKSFENYIFENNYHVVNAIHRKWSYIWLG